MSNRILKESICTSDTVDKLSWFEEVFFCRLIVNCDDFGRMDARPAILRSKLFPLKSVTDKQVESALNALRTAGMVEVYVYDDRPYLQLRTWDKHQQIRAKKSKYPSPQSSDIICNQLISDDSNCTRNPIQSESNPNQNPKETRMRATFTKPSVEEIRAYCKERGNKVDAQRFYDFYESKGWKVGNQTMKDWRACVRTWEQRDSSPTGTLTAAPRQTFERPVRNLDHLAVDPFADEEKAGTG